MGSPPPPLVEGFGALSVGVGPSSPRSAAHACEVGDAQLTLEGSDGPACSTIVSAEESLGGGVEAVGPENRACEYTWEGHEPVGQDPAWASGAIESTEAIGSPFSDWRLHVATSCHRGRGRDWGGGCNWARQPGSSAMEDDWPTARRLAERKQSGLLFLDGLARQRLAAWTRSGSLFLDGLEQQRLAGRTRSGSACLCVQLRLSERLDLHNSVWLKGSDRGRSFWMG